MPFLSVFADRADGSNHTALKLNNFALWINALKSYKTLINTGFKVVAYGDSLDWKDYGVSDIVKRCTVNKDLGKESIILLHSGAKHMPEALEDVIKGLKEQGYELVPVSELIYKDSYTVDHIGRQLRK